MPLAADASWRSRPKAHDGYDTGPRLRIRRDILEVSVTSGLRRHLMQPALVREFVVEYQIARLGSIVDGERDAKRRTVEQTARETRTIIEAVKGGCDTPSMRNELMELEARRERVTRALKESAASP